MQESKNLSSFFIGLALFSMFFGSGNLIFPLFVGQTAETQWPIASLGFGLTAVIVPFIGVVAMVVFRGNYTRFFNILGNKIGFLITFVLLTVWIPFGSAPRCIILAYNSLASYLTMPSIWIVSLFYSFLLFLVVYKKSRMLNILGYFLTPILLSCLAFIVVKGILFTEAPIEQLPKDFTVNMFFLGLKEGYNTMDLIASFFFSASIISILEKSQSDKISPLKKTLHSCIIGIVILGVVYIGLIHLSAIHAPSLEGIPKDQLLAHIAKSVMGENLGIIAAITIVLACFTTSVAMIVVYTDFLSEKVFSRSSFNPSMLLSLLVSFAMSISGIEGITTLTAPILSLFYPSLIILIAVNISKELFWKSLPSSKKALSAEE